MDLGGDAQLVWILGSSRSGNTWLMRMLGELPATATIDDPHLGHHLGVWRPIPLAWAAGEDEPELSTLVDLQHDRDEFFFNDRYADAWEPALRQLILARFEAQVADGEVADGGGDRRAVVVKEPGSQAAELFSRLFPESSLIFLLRDVRDVVASWLDAYRHGSWAEPNGAFAASHDGRVPLARWLASVWLYRVEAVERAVELHPGPTATVRYESLRADPLAEVTRICADAQLPGDDAAIRAAVSTHDFDRVAPSLRGRGRAIREARPGGWIRELRPAELDAVVSVAGSKLVELGYAKAHELRRLRRVA
jgi:sulfotransferase family protein